MAWLPARLSTMHWRNLKYWLRHRIFLPGLWLLWNLQSPVLKPQGVSSETRLCLKFLMFIFQPPQSQDLRPARLCSTCQKNCQGLCWGPRRHESKICRSCINLQVQPLSLRTHIRHSQYIKLQELVLLKIRAAATLGVPTSLICSLPPKDLHPGVRMAKPYMKLVLSRCSLHTERLRQNKPSMINWVGKCSSCRPCFTRSSVVPPEITAIRPLSFKNITMKWFTVNPPVNQETVAVPRQGTETKIKHPNITLEAFGRVGNWTHPSFLKCSLAS